MTPEEYAKKKKSEYWKRFKEERVKNGLCRGCGKEDAFTMNGRSYCADCAEKNQIRHRTERLSQEARENDAKKMREHRKRLEEEGRCIRCGRKHNEEYKTCKYCRAKKRNYNRKKNQEKSATKGVTLCWQCNKEEMFPGYKLCAKCYDMKMKALEIANRVNREIGYYNSRTGRKNKVDKQGNV